jgi:serine/threonine protein kinase
MAPAAAVRVVRCVPRHLASRRSSRRGDRPPSPPCVLTLPALNKPTHTQPTLHTLSNTQSMMYQLIKGLAHCHRHGVMHRDLKPQNLLVDDASMTLKIADLGLGRAFSIPVKSYTHEVGVSRVLACASGGRVAGGCLALLSGCSCSAPAVRGAAVTQQARCQRPSRLPLCPLPHTPPCCRPLLPPRRL